jgi:hypothetical protein
MPGSFSVKGRQYTSTWFGWCCCYDGGLRYLPVEFAQLNLHIQAPEQADSNRKLAAFDHPCGHGLSPVGTVLVSQLHGEQQASLMIWYPQKIQFIFFQSTPQTILSQLRIFWFALLISFNIPHVFSFHCCL